MKDSLMEFNHSLQRATFVIGSGEQHLSLLTNFQTPMSFFANTLMVFLNSLKA